MKRWHRGRPCRDHHRAGDNGDVTDAASTRVLPCGERALLVEVVDLAGVLALSDAVAIARRTPPWDSRIVDVVPAARTVLLVFSEPRWVEAAAAWVADLAAGSLQNAGWVRGFEARVPDDLLLTEPESGRELGSGASSGEPEVEIAVRYDGPDLAEVARMTGLSEDAVIAAHTGTPWRVAFTGFAPGFGYLVGGDTRLVVPRRATPRAVVPAGSVGLAGEYSGVYPRASPGGWQIIGRTDAVFWDADRTPPALLRPGVQVRFVPLV